MDNTVYSSYRIEDRSYLSFVKREIHNLATQKGFTSQKAGEIDIVVSELTSNLIKHASTGELLYRIYNEENSLAFEVFCIDDGPGTNDIAKAMKDGISSTNTLGQGLGSINRLSDFFQIYSKKDWGTIAYAKILLKSATQFVASKNFIDIKAVQVCYPGERVCGDGYYIKNLHDETQIFLGDGLGHGPNAHEAVSVGINAFKECNENSPVEILRYIHQRTKKTRGLVGSVVTLNREKKQWKIAGIGNITTRLYEGLVSKNYMPHNGIIGLNIPNTMKDYEVDVEKYQHIIMYSDGIKNRWDLSQYPSILKYDASIIASSIFKDHARRNDDMTLLVGKVNM